LRALGFGRPGRATARGGGPPVELPGQPRLPAVGGPFVDGSGRNGLVQSSRRLQVARGRALLVSARDGLADLLLRGLQRRAHGLVAGVRPLVLPVPLDLRLDVGHGGEVYQRGRDPLSPYDGPVTDPQLIRNFCIVAHIDHGKSTLADRILDLTHAVPAREMREQYLDRMDLERERGITIKAQAVRLAYERDGRAFVLNLIDTPGHVDFTYEVSRSLAACEGAILLVDAAQGIEAQTLANFHLAKEAGLAIIPAINKIDLPAAEPDKRARELAELVGSEPEDVILVSAKDGRGVTELLEAIIDRVPPPTGDRDLPPRA